MRICDLIKSLKFDSVKVKIQLHYGQKDIDKYEKLFSALKKKQIPDTVSGDLTIFIKTFAETEDDSIFITEFDENDPRLHFDVCGYMDSEDIVYSIAASDYEEFLTYQIDEDTSEKFSPENILAHCLYEITAYGFEK